MAESKLFVVDGQNKSGKSTQVALLAKELNMLAVDTANPHLRTKIVREPGRTPIGEEIRRILLDDLPRQGKTDTLLFAAARLETITLINQMMSEGFSVVSDRSWLSTAFQIYGDYVDERFVRTITELVLADNYQPDAYFLLDIDYGTYMARSSRTDEPDYFERDKRHFNRVRLGFINEARSVGAFVIDATFAMDEVHQQIWDKVQQKL